MYNLYGNIDKILVERFDTDVCVCVRVCVRVCVCLSEVQCKGQIVSRSPPSKVIFLL